jgi:hypothetical protein
MPCQRVLGQLALDEGSVRCSFFIDAGDLEDLEAFAERHRLRYIVVFAGSGEDRIAGRLAAAARARMKAVFATASATIYERIS